jgi:hypothetical protein
MEADGEAVMEPIMTPAARTALVDIAHVPRKLTRFPREKWRAAPTAAYTSDAVLKAHSLHTGAVAPDHSR